MPPSNKASSSTGSTRTLHAYFTPRNISSRISSKSSTTKEIGLTSSAKKSLHETGKTTMSKGNPRSKNLSNFVTHGDVIVITDSDDDEAVRPGSADKLKRKRSLSLDTSSSDAVEFVDELETAASTATYAKRQCSMSVDSCAGASPWAGVSFGTPTLLLSNAMDANVSCTMARPPGGLTDLSTADRPLGDQSDIPVADLRGETQDYTDSLCNNLETDAYSASDDEVAVDLEGAVSDDEWSGDDAAEGNAVCPVCNEKWPTFLELQLHVNACIDLSTAKATSDQEPPRLLPTSVNPFLQPEAGPSRSLNAFSVMMTSNSENQAWKQAATAENQRSSAAKMNGGRRKAPFYKVLPGMPIAVDAFSYGKIAGVTAYFLTHAHSDHYTNLSSKWENGPVYCSHTTASLIQHMLRVDRKWLHPLPMDTPTVIPDTDGVTVTLIDANHCPGSCLFYFEGRHTVDAGDTAFKSSFINSPRIFHYLHCGDFRACPRHVRHPAILGKRMDQVYLDTTYLDPKYTFPPQPLVISACAELATRLVRGEHSNSGLAGWLSKSVPTSLGLTSTPKKEKKILFIVGTYSIGKERIVKAIAHALGSKVYCDARKMSYLQRQPDPELHAMLTANAQEADVHVIPLGLISAENIKPYLNRHQGPWTHVVALRPTGWSFSPTAGADPSPSISTIISRAQSRTFTYEDLKPSRNSTAAIQLFPVPYSEHSSFSELTCFAMSMDWRKIIATVNVGSERSRAKMAKWFGRWEADRRKSPVGYVVESRSPDYW